MIVVFRQLLAAALSIIIASPLYAFTYGAVGNRTQKTSTLPGFPGGGLTNYNANDQLATDAYDANGNTVGSGTNTGSNGYVYDFENHLVQQGGISFTYDGDGNRVSKTTPSGTVHFLVDTQNPTGYAQVIQEQFSSNSSGAQELSHTYVYGLERISEHRQYFMGQQTLAQTFYFDYDGHGSVRALTDPTGAVTDTYDYDAFGNLIHSTGSTPNVYLYSGEQFDPDLNLYYNRARYLSTSAGRFWTTDTWEGSYNEPLSLHKYLYASADPTNRIDPDGQQDFVSEAETEAVGEILDATPILQGVALLAFIAHEFSNGRVETSGSPDTDDDPRFPNRMRVQLQEGLEETFYGVSQSNTQQVGVTVLQMQLALGTLYKIAKQDTSIGRRAFPFSALDDWLYSAVIRLSQKLRDFPPGGIALPQRNFIQEVTKYRGKEYRVDVDNLVGHNLRQ